MYALVSRAFNGGEGAFIFKGNGSKFVVDYINSGRKLNFDNPTDKDMQLLVAAYQRLDTSQLRYMKVVEFRRMRIMTTTSIVLKIMNPDSSIGMAVKIQNGHEFFKKRGRTI